MRETIEKEGWSHTCRERGDEKVVIHQTLKSQRGQCKGHSFMEPTEQFHPIVFKTKAKRQADAWKQRLQSDPGIDPDSIEVIVKGSYGDGWLPPNQFNPLTIQGWRIHGEYRHLDSASDCDSRESLEEEKEWVSSDPAALARLEADERCFFVRETASESGRDLIFACAKEDPHSECRQWRELGGELVSRNCERNNEWGGCEEWLKRYDKRGSTLIKRDHIFKDRGLFYGLHGEFHRPREESNDFKQALLGFGLAEGVRASITIPEDGDEKKVRVFNGAPMECRCSSCCKEMDRKIAGKYMPNCSKEEQTLAALRREKKCHRIGRSGAKEVFCCYPSHLVLRVNEKNKTEWGSADAPDCIGFTVEQMKRLDVSEEDLGEQPYDPDEMNQQIQSFFERGLQS